MAEHATGTLTSLVGPSRAAVLEALQSNPDATCGQLADKLGLSSQAVRKHLGALEADGLVEAASVRQGRGRPARHYRLTDRGRRLFPTRSAAVADELIEFIANTQGRDALREYLAWRVDRQAANLQDAVDATDVDERVHQLADALDAAGYGASVRRDGDGFELTQQHCVIHDVASKHPELCTTEAEAFSRVLGTEVHVRRRLTIANGASACVCHVEPVQRDAAG